MVPGKELPRWSETGNFRVLHRGLAIAGTTKRTNRLASASQGAAEPARLFARLPTVIKATGLLRSTSYRLVASAAFPRRVHLGSRASVWGWSDLEQWNATIWGSAWNRMRRPKTT